MSSAAHAPTPSRAEPERLTRKRAIAVWMLVVVASILLLPSSLTGWVKRQALDTDAWTNASGQMLANDEIREQLSIYLVDTLSRARTHRTDRAGASAEPRRACTDHHRPAPERRGEGRRPNTRDTKGSGPVGRTIRRAHTRLDSGPRGQGHGGRSDHPGRRGRPRPEPARPAAERPFRRTGCPGRRQDHDPPLRSTEERAARAQGDQGAVGLPARARPLSSTGSPLPRPRPSPAAPPSHGRQLPARRCARPRHRPPNSRGSRRLADQDGCVRPAPNPLGNRNQLLRSVAYALILYGVAGLIGAWLAGPTRWPSQLDDGWRPCSRARPGSSTGRGPGVPAPDRVGPDARDPRVVGILLLGGLLFFGVAMLYRPDGARVLRA